MYTMLDITVQTIIIEKKKKNYVMIKSIKDMI